MFLRGNDGHEKARASRLVALYHWAKGTELLSVCMLRGEPGSVSTQLDQQFEGARTAALNSGDPSLEVILSWLHVGARKMVAGSLWAVARAVTRG